MINIVRSFINKVLKGIFKKKKNFKLGLYGPPNGGKTTLANRICKDWLGQDMGAVSNIAHDKRSADKGADKHKVQRQGADI